MIDKNFAQQVFDAIEYAANETKLVRGANSVQVIRFSDLSARVVCEWKNPQRKEEFMVSVYRMQK